MNETKRPRSGYLRRYFCCAVALLAVTVCGVNAAMADEPQPVAGNRVITGTIEDTEGNPIVGAHIIVKGAPLETGTSSDLEGKFSLSVPDKGTLVVSYIGCETLRIPLRARTEFSLVMTESTNRMGDVVVVGYGTQRKSDLTGSIVSVKSEEIADLPVRSVAEALQGKVAGVMVSKTDGRPGSSSDIVIRGVGSINGLNPLFIVDGVARENNTDYNLADVESIEIIKDASAAAIYGSRAAGGVVLITTKRGSFDSKPQLNFSAHVGMRDMVDHYNLLNTPDYIRVKQALGENYPIWSDPSALPNTNWIDALYRTGIEHSYNISLSGGSGKLSYYLSGSYERENGIQERNYWERISARANVDYKVRKNLTVGSRIYLARIKGNPYTVSYPWTSIPYMNIYNEDGSFSKIPDGIDFSGANPYAELYMNHQEQSDLLTEADLYLDWEIVKGLRANITGSAQFGGNYYDYYRELNDLGRSPSLDSYNKALGYSEQYTLTATLTYAKVFAEKHDFKIMAGYEAKYGKFADLNATATDFPVDNPQSFELSTNASKLATGALSDDRFLSVFGRLNYSFDNRYLLTVNFRGDGSPKFSPKNRWGFFPSVSVGWKISEEPFFRNWDQTWLSLVKPRFSWGILGNDQALDKYAYMMSFQKLTEHSFDGTTAVGGYNNVKVINEDIKWESIYTTNVGLDLEFFNHRLLVSADYYKRITRNMIYDIAVPNSSGITTMPSYSAMSTMPVNIGRIDNEGWELQVAYRNNIGFFNYSVSANVSQNSNRVVDIGLPTAFIYGGGGWPNSGLSPCKTVNGMPISMLFGLKTDGLITSQEEIDELNAIAQANGHAYYHQRLTGVGDLKYVDLNGDGTINDEDRTFIGNPWPKVQYGFNISLEYRGIDLSADFVGIAGNDVMNLAKSFTQSVQHSSQTTSEIFNASFFLGNGLTDQPRVMAYDTANGNAPVKDPNLNYQLYSDYFIEDGSYLKLKTLTLGYTLPRRWTRKAGIQKLRVYVSGHNLLTFTKFTGLDPEFASSAKTATGIYYSSTYPQTRMISFGIDMTF